MGVPSGKTIGGNMSGVKNDAREYVWGEKNKRGEYVWGKKTTGGNMSGVKK